ncbi:GlsB/YeaQ/YmgE family stress response membrane protein [Nocardioides speluncae]|uniref:GlsB/YeaQ/YmgE family stress response membrane protein n=1 Tax=Nocardioides speluncae TaxID=2670337 RepID=UPI000D6A041E|nr:GlsB/YeaQ/YmgE family stress response membrane protein [Nocardioides speluncae]
MLGTILAALIGGTIIGLLAKLVAPGDRDNIPLWLTIICGIGGAFLGSYAYAALFDCSDMTNCTKGIDWWRHLWQVGAAVILVMIASAVTGRRRS